jgi:hypothetical protein
MYNLRLGAASWAYWNYLSAIDPVHVACEKLTARGINSSPRRLYQTLSRKVPLSKTAVSLVLSIYPQDKRLTLIDNIDMSEPVTISTQDSVDVSLHDALEVLGIGNVLYPRWELRVPDECMTPNNSTSLFSLVHDLSSASSLVRWKELTRSAPVQLKTPLSAWMTSHFISFSGVYWSNSPSKIGSNLSSAR